jgi:tryptophan synthase alpha chain
MPDRLTARLAACRREGRKAMGLFLTDGFPHPDATDALLDALVAGGADFVELGMPFSDPLAEGLPIQHASSVALRAGVTMRHTLETARRFRSRHDTPLLLMGYVNPVLRYGLSNFCRDSASVGVDGLILPDVPPEESGDLRAAADAAGLATVFLSAPNTPDDRLRELDRLATGFVYAVSVAGVTGAALGDTSHVARYLERARSLVSRPLLVGFGIRTADDARRLTQTTDGFIVGSALIRHIDALWEDQSLSNSERADRVAQFARALHPDS